MNKDRYLFLAFVLSFFCIPIYPQIVLINGVPRDTSYTVYSSFIKEKKKFPFIQPASPELGKLDFYPNIKYKTISANRTLSLNIFKPKTNGILPAVMMIHGGGWNSGAPELQEALATNLAEKGFVCITTEYRLTPEALFPAAIDDLNDALRWIADNSENYGIDRNKIAVSGCSAGGQLATLIGTINRGGLIKAVVNIDGIATFIDTATIERANKSRKSGEKMPVDAQWLGGTYQEKPESWKDASATYFVHAGSAPVCFINSSIARFHNGRDEMIRLLDSHAIRSEVHHFENTPHTFWHFHPWHIATVNFVANFLNKRFDKQVDSLDRDEYDLIVSQDETGDFKSIQAAINAVPNFRKKQTRILIRNGYYFEKIIIPETKDSLILIGEDKFKTIISYNDFASKPTGFGDQLGTSGSASIYISPAVFRVENITFENSAGPIGQAVAVIVRSDKAQFVNCRFLGFQDTLYAHKIGSKQYYKNCYIEGSVDFIFGSSIAYFDECEIFCKKSGYVTAASTPQGSPFGFVFYRCTIFGENPNSFYLGRPWRAHAKVAFVECEMSDVIKPEAWNNWGDKTNEKTAQFYEYKNSGNGGNLNNVRVSWSSTIAENEIRNFRKESVLGEDFFQNKK
ncbi:MAG: pectinesterase family protein [Paludibacteraceae bacterium]